MEKLHHLADPLLGRLQSLKLTQIPGPKGCHYFSVNTFGQERTCILIEQSEPATNWPEGAPYVPHWGKGVSLPLEKLVAVHPKYPMSLYCKVNASYTQSVVVALPFFHDVLLQAYRNRTEKRFSCNEFLIISDPEHPSLCFPKVSDLHTVILGCLEDLYKLDKRNREYSFSRPKFKTRI